MGGSNGPSLWSIRRERLTGRYVALETVRDKQENWGRDSCGRFNASPKQVYIFY